MSEIFNITHDAGNLDEYDSLQNPADLAAEADAAMADTAYGLQVTITPTDNAYGELAFTQLTTSAHRYRFYIDPNTLTMAGGNKFTVVRFNDDGNQRYEVEIYYDGGNYKLHARARDDSETNQSTDWYTITDAEHYVEVLVQYASAHDANDATLTLWIDGVQQEHKTGLDIYNMSKPDKTKFGPSAGLDAGTEGIFYLDEFVLRDDATEIGPVGVAALGFAGIF